MTTLIFPSALALVVANLFRLTLAETAGLFMIGVAPGAPLLTRNIARRGFDMQMAASYQVWAALMVPIMIPLLVWAAAKLYSRDIWIPPGTLLKQIVLKQFVPLIVGIAIAWIAPLWSQRVQPAVNVTGNVLLTVMMILVLFKMGPALKSVTPLVPVAALIMAVGCIAAIRIFRFGSAKIRETFAICNANRHIGLALLLSGQYLHAKNALPTIACYALAAPLTMFLVVRLRSHQTRAAPGPPRNS